MAPNLYMAKQIIGYADKIHIQDDPKRGRGMIGTIWIVAFGALGFTFS